MLKKVSKKHKLFEYKKTLAFAIIWYGEVESMYEPFDIDFYDTKFVWDDEKAEANFIKHGIKFTTAARVFLDEKKLIRYDEEHSKYEDRYNVLGKVGNVLFVVCVFIDEKTVRIVSARLAGNEEKRRYRDGQYYDE